MTGMLHVLSTAGMLVRIHNRAGQEGNCCEEREKLISSGTPAAPADCLHFNLRQGPTSFAVAEVCLGILVLGLYHPGKPLKSLV